MIQVQKFYVPKSEHNGIILLVTFTKKVMNINIDAWEITRIDKFVFFHPPVSHGPVITPGNHIFGSEFDERTFIHLKNAVDFIWRENAEREKALLNECFEMEELRRKLVEFMYAQKDY